MAITTFNSLYFTFTKRPAAYNGPRSSEAWNDSIDEIATDQANLVLEWNNKLVPLLTALPNGSYNTSMNAFVNGLDGKNIWVNVNASSDTITRYYNSTNGRPYTIYEAFENTYQYIDTQVSDLQQSISNAINENIIISDTNGNQWKLQVDTSGNLSTIAYP